MLRPALHALRACYIPAVHLTHRIENLQMHDPLSESEDIELCIIIIGRKTYGALAILVYSICFSGKVYHNTMRL
jgi:hypothetical protein